MRARVVCAFVCDIFPDPPLSRQYLLHRRITPPILCRHHAVLVVDDPAEPRITPAAVV